MAGNRWESAFHPGVYLTCSKEPHIDPGEIVLIRKRMQAIFKQLASDEVLGDLSRAMLLDSLGGKERDSPTLLNVLSICWKEH